MAESVSVEKVLGIIEHYGGQHQLYKVAEELSELQTIVLQDANKKIISKGSIAEEIADCYVMLRQLELIYGLDDRDIQPIIDGKIYRVFRRMEYESTEGEISDRTDGGLQGNDLEREDW